MKSLSHPLPGVQPEDIFEECVSSFQNREFSAKLKTCGELIKSESEEFSTKLPDRFDEYVPADLPGAVNKEDLIKVYKEKFAAKAGPCRKYYDKIKANPKGSLCPICGVRLVNDLDHYLPKAGYPLLVVTPLNLIPTCRDCNRDKLNYAPKKEAELTFNPYFDNVNDECWLAVKLRKDQSVLYYVDAPSNWNETMTARARQHLAVYKLPLIYGSHAAQEINDSIKWWRELYKQCGRDKLLDLIIEVRDSAEFNELNSWRAALYRGLVDQFDILVGWL